jgi:uncharacterized protein (TIGR02996 family)
MSELHDLLAGIRATPEDDAPRLILADWLDEHDEPERAEFIRLQVRLSRWVPDLEEREQLQAREHALLTAYGTAWLGPIVDQPNTFSRFERGLLRIATTYPPRVAAHPWVGAVRLLVETEQGLRTAPLPQYPPLVANERRFCNSVGIWMQHIPAGTFRMGTPSETTYPDDEHQRTITLTQPFALGTFPITVQQYDQLIQEREQSTERREEHPDEPVERISWEEAIAFCRMLSSLPEERAAGRRYRLPTEAEWEYACRAGTTTAYNFGDEYHPIWMNGNRDYGHLLPVGCFDPNAFGLYDNHGQVREWCSDIYRADLRRIRLTNPHLPRTAKRRGNPVMRGGSWDTTAPTYCRSAYRVYTSTDAHTSGVGFRIACDFVAASGT